MIFVQSCAFMIFRIYVNNLIALEALGKLACGNAAGDRAVQPSCALSGRGTFSVYVSGGYSTG